MQVGAIFAAARAGDAVLVRAQWLLARAGYKRNSKERKGRTVYSWALPSEDAPLSPMPCRQALEADHPEAVMPAAELEAVHAAYLATVAATPHAAKEPGLSAVPVVLASHAWETKEHPDPAGRTLRRLAATLA